MLGKLRRLALLAEGRFTPLDAKTAVGVLRYRPEEVVAVLDSTRAGGTAANLKATIAALPAGQGSESSTQGEQLASTGSGR